METSVLALVSANPGAAVANTPANPAPATNIDDRRVFAKDLKIVIFDTK
jgi:hypothetical protein